MIGEFWSSKRANPPRGQADRECLALCLLARRGLEQAVDLAVVQGPGRVSVADELEVGLVAAMRRGGLAADPLPGIGPGGSGSDATGR
jgi:hypothetical protein